MRCKKGQFYFIIAMIIVLVLVGFITISNFSVASNDNELNDLKSELDIEIEYLMDYITLSGDFSRFENFSQIYINELKETKNVIFMYGTSEDITLKGSKIAGTNFNTSESSFDDGEFIEDLQQNPVEVNFEGNTYSFEFTEGQNFYYLITKQKRGEVQIIRN